MSHEHKHDDLVKNFSVYLDRQLAAARAESPTVESVIQASLQDVQAAIEAKRHWRRALTDKEEWIIHQYLGYLEDAATLAHAGADLDPHAPGFSVELPDGDEREVKVWSVAKNAGIWTISISIEPSGNMLPDMPLDENC